MTFLITNKHGGFTMITLLAPYALFGASLLAIPILVHLFKPRKVRQTPFSSLRWLHLTQQRLSRRIKWHQVFLFLLRAAFLLLLVFALAKPMHIAQGTGRSAERFVVLDVSRSMSYRQADRPTPLEAGKEITADLLTHQSGGDRTALLLTGSTTQVVGPLTTDAEVYLPALQAVQPGLSDTDLCSALQAIRPMLSQRRPDSDVEIYFITDNHQQSWNQSGIASFLRDLPVAVHTHIVDVGVPSPQNAWIADARLIQADNPPRRTLRVQLGCVGDANQERTVRLADLPGLPERTQPVTITPGRSSAVDFELPGGYDLGDKVAHFSLEPEDGLPSDDHFFLNLDTKGALRVLHVEPDSTAIETQRPGLHLRTAIEVLSAAGNNPVELVSKTPAQVAAKDISEADVILLAEVPELSDPLVSALEERIRGGGGLAIFLGPGIKPGFYNTRLYRPLFSSEGLLPASLKAVAEPDPEHGGLAPLTNVRWTHPLLTRLSDPVLGDLPQTHFRSFYQFASPLRPNDLVLASIADSVPAIVERSLGAGKVLLFNTTANDVWSDLPRRKSYVPLIDRLLSYLSGGGVRRTFEVGDPVALPLPLLQDGEKVTVTTPGGSQLTPALTTTEGRTILRLPAVDEPGVYRVEPTGRGEKSFSFVVQVGRGDSVLTPLDGPTLQKWWEPAACDFAAPDAFRQTLAAGQGRLPLWPILVALAGLMLLAEMFFVHWLCPRVNPSIVESVVHKRRILAAPGRSAGE
jgi:hypothetical protein